MKSTVDQIRERFDNDVERFSNLESGQSATIDAPLVLDLIADAAAGLHPGASHILDIGCGAGNYTLKLLQKFPGACVTMVDLSKPMLDRARERVSAICTCVSTIQGDVRLIDLDEDSYDVIVAGAVLHHLREEAEWQFVFRKLFLALKPGGSLWIADLIEHSSPEVQAVMWRRYGAYLAGLKGEAYREQVFQYIDVEDSPRPLMFQIDLLRHVGFIQIDVLHKNSVFAAFGGRKPQADKAAAGATQSA